MDYLKLMCDTTGYKPVKEEIWISISLAEAYDKTEYLESIVEGIFEENKNDYKVITELVMFLNWKLWYHYEQGEEELAKIYNDLWEKYDVWAIDNLKDDELDYFFQTTD